MALSRRTTNIITGVTTATILGGVGAFALTLDDEPSSPSISQLAAGDGAVAENGWDDPWGDHEARCQPIFDVLWAPSEEELADVREHNQQMMAELDEAGVDYELVTAEDGWEYVEPADGDYQAFETALSSFYEDQGPSEEHLEQIREDNAATTAALDEAGIEYELLTDEDGWEHVEPAGEDGWEAMDRIFREQESERMRELAEERGLDVEEALACHDEQWELNDTYYGSEDFGTPLPMDPRLVTEHVEMMEELMTVFDEAGVDYQRIDVPMVQWDREDEAAQDLARSVAEQFGYGSMMHGGTSMAEETDDEIVTEDAVEEPAG